jgi:hypothetical protein
MVSLKVSNSLNNSNSMANYERTRDTRCSRIVGDFAKWGTIDLLLFILSRGELENLVHRISYTNIQCRNIQKVLYEEQQRRRYTYGTCYDMT